MSSGDMTKEEAMARQTFTGHLRCDEADQYDAKDAPTCLPICEVCMLKWIEADLPVADEDGMSIKEHIEAGHYPLDEKGRALVQVGYRDRLTRTFVVTATDRPCSFPITGWYLNGGNVEVFTEDGLHAGDRMLPPPPRKVRIEGWAVLATDLNGELYIVHGARNEDAALRWGCNGQPRIRISGEYEEPWATASDERRESAGEGR